MMDLIEHPVRRDAEPLVSRFAREVGHADDPRWLRQMRKEAMACFAENGFPSPNHEEWRFTNIAPVLTLSFEPLQGVPRLSPETLGLFLFPGLDAWRLVFVDGGFVPELSHLPPKEDGITLVSLHQGLLTGDRNVERHLGQYVAESNAFAALNTAFFRDGAYLALDEGKCLDKPVHILNLLSASGGDTAHSRHLIIAGRNSQLRVIESYGSLSGEPSLSNSVTEVVLEEGARVDHCKIQLQNEVSYHLSAIHARQDKDTRWNSHSISIGARLARTEIVSSLAASGAECVLNGLFLGRGEQCVDHHTTVDHQTPNCESHEYYHGILADRAHGVFNGKIYVRQDAQKTNARQTSRNLLLSDEARIDAKPQLEIFADDVKCTHGATVGRLDADQLFYLRARGIGEDAARRMLIRAFASQAIGRLPDAPVREALDDLLLRRFA
jgi:Fe-S cluster assembly protein SufD